MIDLIKENIGWIKDFVTLILAVTAIIISILTYRRARATILAPIRNEVVKKQSIILSEILDFVRKNKNDIDFGLDYVNLAKLNTFVIMREYGFQTENQVEVEKMIGEDTAHWLFVPKSDRIKEVEVIQAVSDTKKEAPTIEKQEETSKEKYEKAKEGIVEITKVHITKAHSEFYETLMQYCDSPFLPNNIRNTLLKIKADVNTNRTTNLISTLESFLLEYVSESKKGNYQNVNPSGVYNLFNRNRIHHSEQLVELKKEIRTYLRIDDKW
jgi:hypothetical protein